MGAGQVEGVGGRGAWLQRRAKNNGGIGRDVLGLGVIAGSWERRCVCVGGGMCDVCVWV